MASIERFEDIGAWKTARVLVQHIYEGTTRGAFARDFGLRDQIQRAAVSIMSNIAEGFERGSSREFRQFLYVAKASAAEVRSLLYVAHDLDYFDDATHDFLQDQVLKASAQIAGFIRYLSNNISA